MNMAILKVLSWLKTHKNIALNTFLCVLTALSITYGITTHKQNKVLSERIEIANNNIEAYQGIVQSSEQANNVLKLDMQKLNQQNDELIKKIDSVRVENKISNKHLNTAATQTQSINVNKSKGVRGDIIANDTIYKDSIQFNPLTTVYYTINKDSISVSLDINNTQYLYIYKKKEYKNKKSLFKRIFTLDFKKVYKYKYNIINTNDCIKQSDIRIIEQE